MKRARDEAAGMVRIVRGRLQVRVRGGWVSLEPRPGEVSVIAVESCIRYAVSRALRSGRRGKR